MEEDRFAVTSDDDGPGPAGQEIDDHVDVDILDELFTVLDDGTSDGLVRACAVFRSTVPTRLGDAETALADGRMEDAARAAHSLRGSAGAFGARGLSAMAQRLEERCVEQDATGAAPLPAQMRAEFEEFLTILDSRLARLSG